MYAMYENRKTKGFHGVLVIFFVCVTCHRREGGVKRRVAQHVQIKPIEARPCRVAQSCRWVRVKPTMAIIIRYWQYWLPALDRAVPRIPSPSLSLTPSLSTPHRGASGVECALLRLHTSSRICRQCVRWYTKSDRNQLERQLINELLSQAGRYCRTLNEAQVGDTTATIYVLHLPTPLCGTVGEINCCPSSSLDWNIKLCRH